MKVIWRVGKPNTCWFHNDWRPSRRIGLRHDLLFAFQRIYSRQFRYYGYVLIIGRLRITFLPNPRTTTKETGGDRG